MMVRLLRTQEIPHGGSRVNTLRPLATMAPRALSALALAFARAPWRRRLLARGGRQEVRRKCGVGADHPDQHLAIFGATTLGFKSPQQGRGVFEAQINLSEIVEQLKASKHDGLHHRKGNQDSGVRIRGSDLTEPWREVKHACRKETILCHVCDCNRLLMDIHSDEECARLRHG